MLPDLGYMTFATEGWKKSTLTLSSFNPMKHYFILSRHKINHASLYYKFCSLCHETIEYKKIYHFEQIGGLDYILNVFESNVIYSNIAKSTLSQHTE